MSVRIDLRKPPVPEHVPVRTPDDAELEARLRGRVEQPHGHDFVEAVEDYAVFCSRTGRQHQAVPVLEKLATIDGNGSLAAWAWLKAGQLLEQVDDHEAALACYERGTRADFADRQVAYFLHNNLGFCLNVLGRHEEAHEACQQAIAIDAGPYNAHKNLGIALEALGRPADAARAYLAAIRKAPGEGRAFMHLASLLEAHPELAKQRPHLRRRLAQLREAQEKLRRRTFQ